LLDAERKINGANMKVEITAVADVFKTKAEGAAKSFKALDKDGQPDKKNPFSKYAAQIKVTPETTFDGLDAYQKLLNSGVDLVILATPPGFRPLHLEAAVRAGKNIFCEKPVAVDATGARKCFELVEESKKKNIAIVAGTQRRHQKGYIETIKKLQDGAIGDITAARCSWNGSGIWFHGRQKGEADAHYQIRNWYHFLWLCGDHIVEQHVHNIDVANWVLGAHPVKATGVGGRQWRTDPRYGHIYDHFAIDFEYPSGARVLSMCRQIDGTASKVAEHFIGSKGSSNAAGRVLGANAWTFASPEKPVSPYVQEHTDLIASIRAGTPLNELKQVAESTLTAILGREAAYTGKEITWEEMLNADQDLTPPRLAYGPMPVPPVPMPGRTVLARRFNDA
jgi:predicted dehydrogenase